MAGTKHILGLLFVLAFGATSFGQITSGKIIFERKSNLKKLMGDNPRFKDMITEDNKIMIDRFTLYFTKEKSAFIPIESEEPQGMLGNFTQENIIHQDINKQQNHIQMDLFGSKIFVQDSIVKREWKITDSKRTLAGHVCRKAIWNKDDSTRIYAWFATDIVPSIGPEGFAGLPGAILGLATEDGSIIYFAKEVEAMTPPAEQMVYKQGKDEPKSIKDTTAFLMKRFKGQPWGERLIYGLFYWYN